MLFFVLAFFSILRINFTKPNFWERGSMKQELILLESAYFDDGENFAELFKRSIETFL